MEASLFSRVLISDPAFNGVRVFWVYLDLSMGAFLFSRAFNSDPVFNGFRVFWVI